jgi:hypothetical protein
LWICFAFVGCTYYSMLLKIHLCALYTCPLSVQAFMVTIKVKVRVTLGLMIYCQPVYLDVKPLEDHNKRLIFFNWTLAVIVLM